MTPSAAGKGDDCRIGDFNIYRDNYDRIFGKNKAIQDIPSECEIVSSEKSQSVLNDYLSIQKEELKDSCGLTDEEFEAFIEKRREELSETQLLDMNIVSAHNSGTEFNKLAKEAIIFNLNET